MESLQDQSNAKVASNLFSHKFRTGKDTELYKFSKKAENLLGSIFKNLEPFEFQLFLGWCHQ